MTSPYAVLPILPSSSNRNPERKSDKPGMHATSLVAGAGLDGVERGEVLTSCRCLPSRSIASRSASLRSRVTGTQRRPQMLYCRRERAARFSSLAGGRQRAALHEVAPAEKARRRSRPGELAKQRARSLGIAKASSKRFSMSSSSARRSRKTASRHLVRAALSDRYGFVRGRDCRVSLSARLRQHCSFVGDRGKKKGCAPIRRKRDSASFTICSARA